MRYQRKKLCVCSNPCSNSTSGRAIYLSDDIQLRQFPGIDRDSTEFVNLYKSRTIIERGINTAKHTFFSADSLSQNISSVKSDLYFSCIAQLITFLLAAKLNRFKDAKATRRLIKNIA